MVDDKGPEQSVSEASAVSSWFSDHEAEWAAETRSDAELFKVASTETDDDKHAHAVFTLRYRGTREIYDAAVELCRSKWATERRCGVNVLALFGHRRGWDHPFHEETVDLFLDMLKREKRVTVIHMLMWGLEELDDDRAVGPIIEFKHHRNRCIRRKAATVLGHFGATNEDALRAVIDLCRDQDKDVRDWATFALGTQFQQGDLDLPEAHAVLWERADEDDREIRSQALRGLAFRGERELTERLIRELDADEIFDDVLEAIEHLADPVFLPHLLPLREWEGMSGLVELEAVIAACGGEARSPEVTDEL